MKKETRPKYEPYVDQADVCELAHELTRRECARRKIKMDRYTAKQVKEHGEQKYTGYAQNIFDKYYDLITNTLNV